MTKLLKFGGTPGQRPEVGILAMRGGAPQRVESADSFLGYPGFRQQSELEYVATPTRMVVMPDVTLPIYRNHGYEIVREIMAEVGALRWFGFFHSRNASAYVEMLSRFQKFEGVVICSAIDPPGEAFKERPRLPVSSLVLHETKELDLPLTSNIQHAKKIEAIFAKLGRCERWQYDGGHRWPAEWNARILHHWSLPA